MRLNRFGLLIGLAALLAIGACGEDVDQNGVLRIINAQAGPITVTITFPNTEQETVPLNTGEGVEPETLVAAPFVLGEVYTFEASTADAGIDPADPTQCTVAQTAVDNREAEIRVMMPDAPGQLTIECGPRLRDSTNVAHRLSAWRRSVLMGEPPRKTARGSRLPPATAD